MEEAHSVEALAEVTMPRRRVMRTRTYTVEEIAFATAQSLDTVYRHIKKGALRVIRVGPARRIRVTEGARREYVGYDDI